MHANTNEYPDYNPNETKLSIYFTVMIVKKFAIDWLSAVKTLVNSVLEFDSCFAKPPTEVDFLAMEQGWKIEKADIEVLDKTADILDFRHGLTEADFGLRFAMAQGEDGGGVNASAAHGSNLTCNFLKSESGLLVFGFEEHGIPDEKFAVGQHV